MSQEFEISFQSLGKCVNKLSIEAQHLHTLFNICLHAFKENKLEKANSKARKKVKHENSPVEISLNKINLPQKSVPENKRSSNKSLNLDALRPIIELYNMNKESSYIKTEIDNTESSNIFQNINMKRASPECLDISSTSKDISIVNNKLSKPKTPKPSQNKKGHNIVFSILSNEEKSRIFYDKAILGSAILERKWGIHHKILKSFEQSMRKTYNTKEKERIWLESQRIYIEEKMGNMVIEDITQNIENILLSTYSNNTNTSSMVNIEELCKLAFERGLAVAGAKYHINLFELEYILQNKYKRKWEEMEGNKWYNVMENEVMTSRLCKERKLEIARRSEVEGVMSVSKSLGINKYILTGYRKLLDDENKRGVI